MSRHLGGQILVATGDAVWSQPRRVTDPIRDGLRFVVVLDGSMTLDAGGTPRLEVEGPMSLALYSDGESLRDQYFRGKALFRFVLVEIDAGLVEAELGISPATLLRASKGKRAADHLVLNARHADDSTRAVAMQILACPDGPQHHLYRASKALELCALVLEAFDERTPMRRAVRLTAPEAERIRRARDLLLSSEGGTFDLEALALQSGLNVQKLTRGFRSLYGATPHALLQEHRLQTAYRMLSSGQSAVGQVALATGYSQAHFATLFRKRFGMAPSALLRKGHDDQPKATI